MESSLTAVLEQRQSVAVLLLMLRWLDVTGSDAFETVFGVRHAVASGEPLNEELVFFLSVAAPAAAK